MKNVDYQKSRSALRYLLLGKEFHLAHKAFELGLEHHIGTRKDGVTPEFQHQISQGLYICTLAKSLTYPELTLATAFLHDIVEDCGFPLESIYDEFGDQVGHAVELMTNQQLGVKKDKKVYYQSMINDPIASICKGVDRSHNHQTMVGVFTTAKMEDYISETSDHILPMLKEARKKHTRQYEAYMNVTTLLKCQMEFVQAIVGKR